MTLKPLTACSALALVAVLSGCASQTPTSPTTTTSAGTTTATTNSVASVTTITDQRTGVTIASPRPVSPLNNAQILYASQPVTLVVNNGFSTGGFTRTYTFEVASDAGFTSIVASKSGVAEGSGGQTSLTLDKLAGKATYYWRVRVVDQRHRWAEFHAVGFRHGAAGDHRDARPGRAGRERDGRRDPDPDDEQLGRSPVRRRRSSIASTSPIRPRSPTSCSPRPWRRSRVRPRRPP